MTIDVDTITGPAFLASALVNGDESGLDAAGRETLGLFLAGHVPKGWEVVDVARDDEGDGEDSRFTWSFDLYGGDCRGGDVVDYVIHRRVA